MIPEPGSIVPPTPVVVAPSTFTSALNRSVRPIRALGWLMQYLFPSLSGIRGSVNEDEMLSSKSMTTQGLTQPAAGLNIRCTAASTSVTARIRALIDNYGGLMSRLNAAALGAALLIGISGFA